MLKYQVMLSNQLWRMQEAVKGGVHDFVTKEDGDTNFISIVIILVIVIALAVMFRDNITKIVDKMWDNISQNLDTSTESLDTELNSF